MPGIFPFRAIHYPWDSDFSSLTAPPYDVIGPEEREALIASHDNNIIRVTLGGDHTGADNGKYAAAGTRLRDWLASGILVQDDDPGFFLYGMTYSVGEHQRTTLGLLASLSLEEFGAGGIYPHERTVPGPIQDRLHLMRTTRANIEPLWFFASSKIENFRSVMEATMGRTPLASVTDRAGVGHALWPVAPESATGLVENIARTPLVIADGHHRYETALAYRQERRAVDGEGPWDQTLALIVDPVHYPPLLKPIHRLVREVSVGQIAELAAEADLSDEDSGDAEPGRELSPAPGRQSDEDDVQHPEGHSAGPESGEEAPPPDHWEIVLAGGVAEAGPSAAAAAIADIPDVQRSAPLQKVNWDLPELVRRVEAAGAGTIGLFTGQGAWIMRSRGEIDTVWLNDNVLEPLGAPVKYEHDPSEVVAEVALGALAFVMAPAPMGLVASRALAGERMPPKTTLFWPKPRTGFVIRDLNGS